MKTALIIPTLNEIDGMRSVVSKIKKEWVDEILIVDGGSTDGTIEEAKNQRSDITLQGTIEEKGEPRTVNTKYGETQVCDSYLKDETGRIKLTLWGEDIEKVKNGDTVSIQGAYTTTFRNEVQLNVPKKNGKLEVISN